MKKIKINSKNILSENDKIFLSAWSTITDNPLKYFDPLDSSKMDDYNDSLNSAYDLINSYNSFSILDYLSDLNYKQDRLYDDKGDSYKINSKTLTIAGNSIELCEQTNISGGPGCIRVDKFHYIDLSQPLEVSYDEEDGIPSGLFEYKMHLYQLKEYKQGQIEKQANELRKTFKRLRNIINANITDPNKCLWVTLTYADNITGKDGNEKLYKDFKCGIQRLRRKYGHFEYISVVEPQGRGAWHVHAIFIFNKKIYIPNKEIAAAWGQGFTKTKKMNSDVDNLGSYLTAYLTDIPLDEVKDKHLYKLDDAENFLEHNIIEKEGKKFIKGGRIPLYPLNMKIYRTSRGIKQPEIIKDADDEKIKEVIGDLPVIYETTNKIELDDDKGYINIIRYRQYNKNVSTEEEKEKRDKRISKNKKIK